MNNLNETEPNNIFGQNVLEVKKSRNDSVNVTDSDSDIYPVNGINVVNGKTLTHSEIKLLEELNKTYAHVIVGGKHKVACLIPCPTIGNELSLESLSDFKNRFLTETKIAGLNMGDAWLKWKGKNYKPDGINYYPLPKLCPKSVYNLYEGFSVTPKQGCVESYLKHVKDVICSGDESTFNYVIGWLAHLIQYPMEKPGVALVMKSVEGTGKGAFFEPIKRILGSHASQINGAYQLTGRFNSVVANQQLIFVDEVNLTNPRTADKIKGLITEPRVCLERKGIDPIHIPSFSRFIFASNHDQVLNAGSRERRFLVLEPSAEKAHNREYFQPLWEWIEGSGPSCLLRFLQNYDLSGFDARHAPVTRALVDEKLNNFTPYQNFIFDELCKDKPFDGYARLDTQDMVNKCRIWLEANGFIIQTPKIRSSIGKLIQRMGIIRSGQHGRNAMYELPSKSIMQNKFAHLLGHKKEDIFNQK